jgi:hypothetical protein
MTSTPPPLRQRYPEGRPAGWLHRGRALVAAEDEQARRFLGEALARAGYLADIVGRVPDVRDVADHSLLILQSETAGVELARGFRLQGGAIPLLLLCGGPESADGPCTLDLAPIERLATPFTVPSLRSALGRLLEGRSK